MKKRILILTLLLVGAAQLMAQNFNIQGVLYDSLISKPIPFASVTILSTDSNLIATQRSTSKGNFSFQGIKQSEYLLLVAHPKYATHSRTFELSKNLDLKTISLFQLKQVLKKVVIRDRKAIVVKGDTVTFAADSFATKDGDVVEDLLKLLPGMQVDESGNITNQGKKVEKVLVNGEEFFGNDPTVATRNLPSKAVDKVEVYDAKDAQEEFTGFVAEDKESKVINLKLKKEMNRGFFGKVASAGGWEDRWKQKLMLNRFDDKEQMGAYYLSSSNDIAQLDWQEGQDFGQGSSFVNEDGDMVSTMSYTGDGTSNPFWGGAQYGINKSWKAGARYTNKFEKNNQELNLTYGYLKTRRERNHRSETENLIPNATFFKTETSESENESAGHVVNATYKTDIDSLLRLTYQASISARNNKSRTDYTSRNINSLEAPISSNSNKNTDESINSSVSNSITLNKKFRKKGRTISYSLRHSFNNTNSDGFLLSSNALNLLNGGQNIVLNQKKVNDQSRRNLNSNIIYTEPINEHWKIKVNYSYSDSKNDNSNITLDEDGLDNGNYTRQIDSFSNIFVSNQQNHRPGIVARYDKDKWRISVGGSVNFARFIQENQLRDNSFNYTQTNYIPKVSMRYKISKYKSIKVSYDGRTRAPSSFQLQPFQNNNNPLSIVIGNPNLRISYNQNIRLSYNTHAPLDGKYSYISITGSNQISPIGTHRIFEPNGQTITTYENLPNSYSGRFYVYHGQKIKTSNFRIGLNGDGSYNYTPNLVNNITGHNENIRVNLGPSLRFYDKDLLSFSLNLTTTWNSNKNIGNVNRIVEYLEYGPSLNLDIYLPQFVTLGAYFKYDYTPAVAPYTTPFKQAYLRPYIQKQFLEKRNLSLRFEVFDALNQRRGYHRRNDVNYNTESFYNTLARYWMIGATWNFFSGPSAVKRKGAGGKSSYSGLKWRSKSKRASLKKGNKKSTDEDSEEIIIVQ